MEKEDNNLQQERLEAERRITKRIKILRWVLNGVFIVVVLLTLLLLWLGDGLKHGNKSALKICFWGGIAVINAAIWGIEKYMRGQLPK